MVQLKTYSAGFLEHMGQNAILELVVLVQRAKEQRLLVHSQLIYSSISFSLIINPLVQEDRIKLKKRGTWRFCETKWRLFASWTLDCCDVPMCFDLFVSTRPQELAKWNSCHLRADHTILCLCTCLTSCEFARTFRSNSCWEKSRSLAWRVPLAHFPSRLGPISTPLWWTTRPERTSWTLWHRWHRVVAKWNRLVAGLFENGPIWRSWSKLCDFSWATLWWAWFDSAKLWIKIHEKRGQERKWIKREILSDLAFPYLPLWRLLVLLAAKLFGRDSTSTLCFSLNNRSTDTKLSTLIWYRLWIDCKLPWHKSCNVFKRLAKMFAALIEYWRHLARRMYSMSGSISATTRNMERSSTGMAELNECS